MCEFIRFDKERNITKDKVDYWRTIIKGLQVIIKHAQVCLERIWEQPYRTEVASYKTHAAATKDVENSRRSCVMNLDVNLFVQNATTSFVASWKLFSVTMRPTTSRTTSTAVQPLLSRWMILQLRNVTVLN